MKICIKCRELLTLDEFPPLAGSNDGRNRKCYRCFGRSYTCVECGVEGWQGPHGKARKWCPECVSAGRAAAERKKRANTPKPVTRKCLICGKGFPWSRTPYCSEACRPLRKCRGCGEEFNLKNRTYCSDECKPLSNRLSYAEKKTLRPARACVGCDQQFQPCRREQRWCSLACYNRHNPSPITTRRYSPEEARERIRESWRQKNRRRRAAKRGAPSERYTLVGIATRDKHRCGLCGKRVAMKQKVPHPKAPTIDHIVPLLDGGDDTRANVQLAHFLCNSAKGPRGSQQLALIG